MDTLLPQSNITTPPADVYVAPDGNDSWSGTFAEPDLDEGDGPFATLARARDAVRALKVAQPNRDVLVLIREGAYPLRDTVVFDLRDSAGDSTMTKLFPTALLFQLVCIHSG